MTGEKKPDASGADAGYGSMREGAGWDGYVKEADKS